MLLLVAVGLGSLNASKRVETAVAPPATFFASPELSGDSATNQFVADLLPRLDVLVGEGLALTSLAEQRSRNIVELTIRMDRFRDAMAEIERVLADTPMPAVFDGEIRDLRFQMHQADIAIDGSLAAIRSFDWDSLEIEVGRFGDAIHAIQPIAFTLAAHAT